MEPICSFNLDDTAPNRSTANEVPSINSDEKEDCSKKILPIGSGLVSIERLFESSELNVPPPASATLPLGKTSSTDSSSHHSVSTGGYSESSKNTKTAEKDLEESNSFFIPKMDTNLENDAFTEWEPPKLLNIFDIGHNIDSKPKTNGSRKETKISRPASMDIAMYFRDELHSATG